MGSYSPDDGNFKYWKKRENEKFASKNVDLQSNFDRHLADTQSLICPVCDQSLLSGEFQLHRHHIIPTSQSGKNTAGNLLLLHLPCHNSVHYGSNPDKWIPVLQDFKEQCRISRLDQRDLESFE
jgi:RNA-directed DNA polymerase